MTNDPLIDAIIALGSIDALLAAGCIASWWRWHRDTH